MFLRVAPVLSLRSCLILEGVSLSFIIFHSYSFVSRLFMVLT